MAAQAVMQKRTIQFLLIWPCQLSDLQDLSFNDEVRSPVFRTVHKGVGMDSRLYIYPNGSIFGDKEYHDHLGLYFSVSSNGTSEIALLRSESFIEMNGTRRNLRTLEEDFFYVEEGCLVGYHPRFFPKDLGKLADFSKDGIITFGLLLRISESEFDWKNILLSKEEIESERDTTVYKCFSDVTCVKIEPDEPLAKKGRFSYERPTSDQLKALDFQIHTKDQCVIWCHKVILGKKNDRFFATISNPMKESEECVMEVNYNSTIMMELLHYIYREKVSSKFQSLDLHDMLDASHAYDIEGLKNICNWKLIEQLEVENAAGMLELADRYELKLLRNMSVNLIMENISEVKETEKGKKLRDLLWDEVHRAAQNRFRVCKMPVFVKKTNP